MTNYSKDRKQQNTLRDEEIMKAVANDPDAAPILTEETAVQFSRQRIKHRKQGSLPDVLLARHKVGLSQKHFAHLLGISIRTLQEWEQGRKKPSGAADSLLKIALERPDVLLEVLHNKAA